MNVLKPHLETTLQSLLGKGVSQQEIKQMNWIDRKTIRRYGRLHQLLPSKDDNRLNIPSEGRVATGVRGFNWVKVIHAGHWLRRKIYRTRFILQVSHIGSS